MPKLTQSKIVPKAKQEEESKIKCLCCGNETVSNFYISHSPYNKSIPYIPYCKKCIKNTLWRYYMARFKNNEQLALHGLLRALNVPYIHSIYVSSVKTLSNPDSNFNTIKSDSDIEQSNDKTENEEIDDSMLVSAYFKTYNSFHDKMNYGDTYMDSEGINEIEGLAAFEETISIKRKSNKNKEVDIDKYDIYEYDADELIAKWGRFPDDKLINLEREYLDWAEKLGDYIYDKSTETIIKQACFQIIDIQEKRERGERVKDELTSLQALLTNSGLIDKTQEKSKNDTKIGMSIREIENNHPVPEPDEDLQNVDNQREMIEAIIGGTSRAFGKDNYFTHRFDEIFADYNIDIIKNFSKERNIEDGRESENNDS